jgi:glucan phosphoethanolaminetransferase (alkaline phosphatase superfamily)
MSGQRAQVTLLALLSALAAGYIVSFCVVFSHHLRVVALHVLFTGGIHAALAWLTWRTRLRAVRPLAAAVWVVWATALAALYVGDFASNYHWDHNLHWSMVGGYLLNWRSYLFLADRYRQAAPLLAALAALAAAVAWLAWRSLDQAGRPAPPTRLPLRRWIVAGALGCYAATLALLLQTPFRARVLQLDPLYSFVHAGRLFPETPEREAAERADAEERARLRQTKHAPRRSVILILVDCLRADHLPLYGYERETAPFLSQLYAQGRLRRVNQAFATCPDSACGILSTLASRSLPRLAVGNLKVHDVLGDLGYQVNFILSGTHAAWYELRLAYGASVTHFFDGHASGRYAPTDDRALFEGLDRVADFDGRPAFFYFHLMSAHEDGVRLPEFRRWQPDFTERPKPWLPRRDGDLERKINHYDNGVLQADALIARLWERLGAKGYLSGSLVMILGDHGEAFGEHGTVGHGKTLYQESIAVPWLIYDDAADAAWPPLAVGAQVDVAPTMLDRLGLPIPATWEGRSLLRPSAVRQSRHDTSIGEEWTAVVRAEAGRLTKEMYSRRERRRYLFDLLADPQELRNLAEP